MTRVAVPVSAGWLSTPFRKFANVLVSISICRNWRLSYGERFAGPRQVCLYITTFFRYPWPSDLASMPDFLEADLTSGERGTLTTMGVIRPSGLMMSAVTWP